jgi:hypothetical protein
VAMGAGLALLVAACSGGSDEATVSADASTAEDSSTTAAPATTETPTTPAVPTTEPVMPTPDDITETSPVGDFGYSMDLAPGWVGETRNSITIVAQNDAELANQLSADTGPSTWVSVSFDHRSFEFMAGIGIGTDNPTADNLLAFNTTAFGWTTVEAREQVELFGTTAVKVEGSGPLGAYIAYQGVLAETDEIFFLGVKAKTNEELEAFRPAWEAMLASIAPTSRVRPLSAGWGGGVGGGCGELGLLVGTEAELGQDLVVVPTERGDGSDLDRLAVDQEGRSGVEARATAVLFDGDHEPSGRQLGIFDHVLVGEGGCCCQAYPLQFGHGLVR